MIVLQLVFWLCVVLIFHSYVIYPCILWLLTRNKKNNELIFSEGEKSLPHIDILLAAYNEEKVIRQKIESTFSTTYPLDKIHFYIGSDASTDTTEKIIEDYQHKFPQLILKKFSKSGKIKIVNELHTLSTSPVLILTDANVFFEKQTLFELVKHFKNPAVGLVGGNIITDKLQVKGIAVQESFYQKRENDIKYMEGVWGGVMMGAFGGCYALRRESFTEVPLNHLVDDFYITLSSILKGYKAIGEKNALAQEDVSVKISEEFRRKSRISAGNFQNLARFASFLYNPFKKASFAFISHKVLRWLAPFLIITSLVCNIFIYSLHDLYKITLWGQCILLLIPLLDWFLKNININLKLLRFITHFYGMNLALLAGFFKFLTGIKSSVWQPTERNQK